MQDIPTIVSFTKLTTADRQARWNLLRSAALDRSIDPVTRLGLIQERINLEQTMRIMGDILEQ